MATVTVIWAGLLAWTVMPGGTETETERVYVPTSRSATDTVPTSVDVSKALSAAVAPPSVTMIDGADRL